MYIACHAHQSKLLTPYSRIGNSLIPKSLNPIRRTYAPAKKKKERKPRQNPTAWRRPSTMGKKHGYSVFACMLKHPNATSLISDKAAGGLVKRSRRFVTSID